ncbi:MAG: hypothetical protein ACJ76Z_02205 [Thermoleophilaceae bacterium]
MFVVILFLLGLSFGYAAGFPWGLLAFVVPLLLVLAASNKSAGAIVVGFVVTALGLLAGLALTARGRAGQHA